MTPNKPTGFDRRWKKRGRKDGKKKVPTLDERKTGEKNIKIQMTYPTSQGKGERRILGKGK